MRIRSAQLQTLSHASKSISSVQRMGAVWSEWEQFRVGDHLPRTSPMGRNEVLVNLQSVFSWFLLTCFFSWFLPTFSWVLRNFLGFYLGFTWFLLTFFLLGLYLVFTWFVRFFNLQPIPIGTSHSDP